MQILRERDIIGAKIITVFHKDLQFTEGYQDRLVIVDVSSGIRICLRQDFPIVSFPNRVGRLCVRGQNEDSEDDLQVEISVATEPDLDSEIAGVFIPFGWESSVGLMLKNGCVLHYGFGDTSNGALFYQSDSSDLRCFEFFKLP